MSAVVEIWADGGCQGNPGPGGWAFVLRAANRRIERSGFDPQTTNNRMELIAVTEALREAAGIAELRGLGITVTTDSQYVQKGITQWIHSWVRNGWKTTGKAPVKNAELWSALWELSKGMPVRWLWVMGHAGDEMNEACHSMVERAIRQGLKQES
jgi:ribonuclease HI